MSVQRQGEAGTMSIGVDEEEVEDEGVVPELLLLSGLSEEVEGGTVHPSPRTYRRTTASTGDAVRENFGEGLGQNSGSLIPIQPAETNDALGRALDGKTQIVVRRVAPYSSHCGKIIA